MDDPTLFGLLVDCLQPMKTLVPTLVIDQTKQSQDTVASSAPQVILDKILDHRYGFPSRRWVPVDGVLHWIEDQKYETTVQVTVACDVEADTATASDLANYAAALLAGLEAEAKFKALKAGRERITDVRSPSFTDDRDENVGSPNFDIVVTHTRSRTIPVPGVRKARLKGIYRV